MATFISRDTYQSSKEYRECTYGKGKPLVDARVNEFQKIIRSIHQNDLYSLFGDGIPYGNSGFKIEESTSPSNNFKINAGQIFRLGMKANLTANVDYTAQKYSDKFALTALSTTLVTAEFKTYEVDDLHTPNFKFKFTSGALSGNTYAITDNTANALTLDTDVETAGAAVDDLAEIQMPDLTTPSGADRQDEVYLDIWEEEITGTEDTHIVDPTLLIEESHRKQLRFAVRVAEGGSVPSDTADHKYLWLATINRLDGNANITSSMITDRRTVLQAATDIQGNAYTINGEFGVRLNESHEYKKTTITEDPVGGTLTNLEYVGGFIRVKAASFWDEVGAEWDEVGAEWDGIQETGSYEIDNSLEAIGFEDWFYINPDIYSGTDFNLGSGTMSGTQYGSGTCVSYFKYYPSGTPATWSDWINQADKAGIPTYASKLRHKWEMTFDQSVASTQDNNKFENFRARVFGRKIEENMTDVDVSNGGTDTYDYQNTYPQVPNVTLTAKYDGAAKIGQFGGKTTTQITGLQVRDCTTGNLTTGTVDGKIESRKFI